jgi:arabinogalactan endo-1,4-beta-galactosidase
VEGKENWASVARLINAGYLAAKQRFPDTEVIVHLDRGYDRSLHQSWFDAFVWAGGQWDISGVSFYPYWQPEGTVAQLRSNLENLTRRYGKPTMICEVGGRADAPRETHALLLSVLEAARAVPRCQGVFYWEPLASPEAVGGYLLGACVSAGENTLRFNGALGAFRNKNSKEIASP